MVIDGLEADTIHEKLEKELAIVRPGHYQVQAFVRSMGGYALSSPSRHASRSCSGAQEPD